MSKKTFIMQAGIQRSFGYKGRFRTYNIRELSNWATQVGVTPGSGADLAVPIMRKGEVYFLFQLEGTPVRTNAADSVTLSYATNANQYSDLDNVYVTTSAAQLDIVMTKNYDVTSIGPSENRHKQVTVLNYVATSATVKDQEDLD